MSESSEGAPAPPQNEQSPPIREADAPQQPGPEVTPPENPEDEATRTVHLPVLIRDEFGISLSEARQQIMIGEVLIDGERWMGDRLDLPYDEIKGKEIAIKGDVREFRMTYEG